MLNGLHDFLKTDPWTLRALSLSPMPELSPSNSLRRLKKSLKTTNSLEKYFLPKRSNSDEDLSSLVGSSNSSRLSSGSFTRDCKSRRSLQIPSTAPASVSTLDGESKKNHTAIYSSLSAATSGSHAASIIINNKIIPSRPNAVTVVNLMSPESFQEDTRAKKSIVTLCPSPVPTKASLTKTNSSGDEGTINLPGRAVKKVGFCKTEVHFAADSGKVNIVETDGKPPPTNKFRRRRKNHNPNVHATSGGYAEKPEHINGRAVTRRAAPKGLDSNDTKQKGTAVDNDSSGAYCVVDLESRKFWASPEELNGNGRLHMTTVNLGKSQVKDLTKPEDLTSPKAVANIISRRNPGQNNCNIVTKDSDNNRVLSTIVKTHESTTARVPDIRPSLKKTGDESSSTKKNENNELSDKKIIKKSINSDTKNQNHVYVNVFKTSNDIFPIYENFRIDNCDDKSSLAIIEPRESTSLVSEVAKSLKNTLERKRNKAKSPNKLGKKSPGSLARMSVSNGSIGKTPRDLIKSKITKRSPTSSDAIKSLRKSSPTGPTGIEPTEKRSEIKTGLTRYLLFLINLKLSRSSFVFCLIYLFFVW